MDDGKDLPRANCKAGDRWRLTLGLWAHQTHLHRHKKSDDILDQDATYYLAVSATPTGR